MAIVFMLFMFLHAQCAIPLLKRKRRQLDTRYVYFVLLYIVDTNCNVWVCSMSVFGRLNAGFVIRVPITGRTRFLISKYLQTSTTRPNEPRDEQNHCVHPNLPCVRIRNLHDISVWTGQIMRIYWKSIFVVKNVSTDVSKITNLILNLSQASTAKWERNPLQASSIRRTDHGWMSAMWDIHIYYAFIHTRTTHIHSCDSDVIVIWVEPDSNCCIEKKKHRDCMCSRRSEVYFL